MTTFSPPGKKSCQRERPCRKAAHERHEEKDGCPYFEDACPFLRIHRPQRCGAASPGPSPSGGKKWRLRFRRTWCLPLGLLLGRRDAAPYKGALRMRRAFPFRSSKAPSPIPSPSGGGCRPQGRQERENAAGPGCGNDSSRGRMRTILPFASGHVLPLPSSASRGIGGCHLPPLGEGRDEPAAAL